MTNYWAYVVIAGSIVTFLSVAPYLFGMTGLAANLSMETADPATIKRSMGLLVGALKALVPLSVGGAVLFALFTFARVRA